MLTISSVPISFVFILTGSAFAISPSFTFVSLCKPSFTPSGESIVETINAILPVSNNPLSHSSPVSTLSSNCCIISCAVSVLILASSLLSCPLISDVPGLNRLNSILVILDLLKKAFATLSESLWLKPFDLAMLYASADSGNDSATAATPAPPPAPTMVCTLDEAPKNLSGATIPLVVRATVIQKGRVVPIDSKTSSAYPLSTPTFSSTVRQWAIVSCGFFAISTPLWLSASAPFSGIARAPFANIAGVRGEIKSSVVALRIFASFVLSSAAPKIACTVASDIA